MSDHNNKSFLTDAGAMALMLFMVLWFGHEMVVTGKIPFFRDLGPYFYPMRFSLAEDLRSAALPLWNRHVAAGFPLLADFQSGAFYPPHLLFLLLPFFSAVSAIFLFHYCVAASGSYLLCRHWGYPPYLAMIGGVLFAFGGVVVSLTNLLNHFQAGVWLPWIVLLAEKMFLSYRWRHFLLFELVLLVQFFAGSPEFYVMSMTLAVLASFRLRGNRPEIFSYKKMVLVLLGGNVLVVALAMVQLAPTVELFLHSRRSQAIPYSEAMDWSLNPSNLFNLFFLDKEVDTTVLPGMRLFFLSRASLFVSYYLGAVALFGIGFWALRSSAKERCITSALLAITVLLAFGQYTPIYPFILRWVPILSLVRFPEKFFFLSYGILWFVVIKGIFIFLEDRVNTQKGDIAVLVGIPGVLSLFYLLLRLNTGLLSQFMALKAKALSIPYSTITAAASMLVSVERQLFLSLALLILFFAAKRRLTRAVLVHFLLIAVVFIDLNTAHRDYQYLVDPGFVYQGKRVISKPADDLSRVFYYPAGETLHPAEYSILAHPSFEGAISLVYANLLPNSGVFSGFDYFQEIDAFSRRPYLSFLNFADRADPEARFRLLGVLNVKYIISFRRLPERGINFQRYFPEYPSWLYKVEKTVPRAYVVNQSIQEKDANSVLRRLSSSDFDSLHSVILDEDLGITTGRTLKATANIVRYENQSVVIRAALDDAGILVLADSYYPGWRAYVDGKEKRILRANLFFRAVNLSRGDHTVEFRYEPWSFSFGLVVSLMTLCGLVLVSGFLYFRGRAAGNR
jgi:hypothetical protein